MEIELDAASDMAYIHLAKRTVATPVVTEPLVIRLDSGLVRLVNLDFTLDGRLVGVEVHDASKSLPKEVLSQAKATVGKPRRLGDV